MPLWNQIKSAPLTTVHYSPQIGTPIFEQAAFWKIDLKDFEALDCSQSKGKRERGKEKTQFFSGGLYQNSTWLMAR